MLCRQFVCVCDLMNANTPYVLQSTRSVSHAVPIATDADNAHQTYISTSQTKEGWYKLLGG
jgi:hypothetical protein